MNLRELSDEKLYGICKRYGEAARLWRQRFIGLLPEVNRRRLYEKKGFESIFMFAKIIAGLSEEQVRRTLNLEKKFENKPSLKSLLEQGEVSVNKLARIASIATHTNEKLLAEQVKLLSKSALETLVRDEKSAQKEIEIITAGENDNGFQKPLFEEKSVPGHEQKGSPSGKKKMLNFELDEALIEELNELHSKGIDVNKLVQTMLEQRQENIEQTKNEISETIHSTKARYISVKIKNLLEEEYGTKGSIKNCQKPSKTKHHTQRFSLSHTHDPKYLAPLCQEHHAIAHSIDLQYQQVKVRALNSG